MESNNSDRELLHLAARAAGLRVKHEIENMDDDCIGLCVKVDGQPKFDWNPLTNDGDALRLAVTLQITPTQWTAGGGCTAATIDSDFEEPYARSDGDPFAATRRAIVRAAAQIGELA